MGLLALTISSSFFTGFLPGRLIRKEGAGGGLMGSIVGLVFQLAFIHFGLSLWFEIYLIVGSLILGLIFIRPAEKYIFKRWGMKKRHNGDLVDHDYNQTNIDEVHGQAVAGLIAFLLPHCGWQISQIPILVVSFVFFRIFDVIKPWPIKWIETRGGRGSHVIMIDDTIAGIYSFLVVWVGLITLSVISIFYAIFS